VRWNFGGKREEGKKRAIDFFLSSFSTFLDGQLCGIFNEDQRQIRFVFLPPARVAMKAMKTTMRSMMLMIDE